MTTSVKVNAHCSSDKEVLINHGEHTQVIQDGQEYEFVVYDDIQAVISERYKAVDLNGNGQQ